MATKDMERGAQSQAEMVRFETITRKDLPEVKDALSKIFKLGWLVDDAYASIETYVKQKENGMLDSGKLLYDLEYSAFRNEKGTVIGVIGIYTVQTSAPGFGSPEGPVVARGGWGGVVGEERGKGYGKKIIEYALEEARKKGADIFVAETSPVWGVMHHVFDSLGFEYGASVRDYFGKGKNLVQLSAETASLVVPESKAVLVPIRDANGLKAAEHLMDAAAFARMCEVVAKARYQGQESLIGATPCVMMEDGKPIGSAVLSRYGWEGEPAKVLHVTSISAEEGKEAEVASAIAGKAKELGMRILITELNESTDVGIGAELEKLGMASKDAIKGLYADREVYAASLAELLEKGQITQAEYGRLKTGTCDGVWWVKHLR